MACNDVQNNADKSGSILPLRRNLEDKKGFIWKHTNSLQDKETVAIN